MWPERYRPNTLLAETHTTVRRKEMNRSTRFSLAALALAATASVARGQGSRDSVHAVAPAGIPAVVVSQAAPGAVNAQAGPTVANASVGVKSLRGTDLGLPKPAPLPAETRQNQAMMIVGGVAFVAGAIIDKPAGTIVMLGGAGIGLWGLYRYLE
jgi:hypothetical protein